VERVHLGTLKVAVQVRIEPVEEGLCFSPCDTAEGWKKFPSQMCHDFWCQFVVVVNEEGNFLRCFCVVRGGAQLFDLLHDNFIKFIGVLMRGG